MIKIYFTLVIFFSLSYQVIAQSYGMMYNLAYESSFEVELYKEKIVVRSDNNISIADLYTGSVDTIYKGIPNSSVINTSFTYNDGIIVLHESPAPGGNFRNKVISVETGRTEIMGYGLNKVYPLTISEELKDMLFLDFQNERVIDFNGNTIKQFDMDFIYDAIYFNEKDNYLCRIGTYEGLIGVNQDFTYDKLDVGNDSADDLFSTTWVDGQDIGLYKIGYKGKTKTIESDVIPEIIDTNLIVISLDEKLYLHDLNTDKNEMIASSGGNFSKVRRYGEKIFWIEIYGFSLAVGCIYDRTTDSIKYLPFGNGECLQYFKYDKHEVIISKSEWLSEDYYAIIFSPERNRYHVIEPDKGRLEIDGSRFLYMKGNRMYEYNLLYGREQELPMIGNDFDYDIDHGYTILQNPSTVVTYDNEYNRLSQYDLGTDSIHKIERKNNTLFVSRRYAEWKSEIFSYDMDGRQLNPEPAAFAEYREEEYLDHALDYQLNEFSTVSIFNDLLSSRDISFIINQHPFTEPTYIEIEDGLKKSRSFPRKVGTNIYYLNYWDNSRTEISLVVYNTNTDEYTVLDGSIFGIELFGNPLSFSINDSTYTVTTFDGRIITKEHDIILSSVNDNQYSAADEDKHDMIIISDFDSFLDEKSITDYEMFTLDGTRVYENIRLHSSSIYLLYDLNKNEHFYIRLNLN